MTDRAPHARSRKPTDLLTVEDIAAEFGWTTIRAQRLLRSLGRQGLVWKFEGHRRAYIRRADLEAAMTPSVYEPEGGPTDAPQIASR